MILYALEYMIWYTLFETIRQHTEKLESEQNIKLMYNWKPLSEKEIENIRKLTS